MLINDDIEEFDCYRLQEVKEAGTVSTVIWPPKISEIIRIS
jgi:hypothetical protein